MNLAEDEKEVRAARSVLRIMPQTYDVFNQQVITGQQDTPRAAAFHRCRPSFSGGQRCLAENPDATFPADHVLPLQC
jgi:hypothetical protein